MGNQKSMFNNQCSTNNITTEDTEDTEKKERIRRLLEIRVIRGNIVLFYFSDFSVRPGGSAGRECFPSEAGQVSG
jgi:hypothetical protein